MLRCRWRLLRRSKQQSWTKRPEQHQMTRVALDDEDNIRWHCLMWREAIRSFGCYRYHSVFAGSFDHAWLLICIIGSSEWERPLIWLDVCKVTLLSQRLFCGEPVRTQYAISMLKIRSSVIVFLSSSFCGDRWYAIIVNASLSNSCCGDRWHIIFVSAYSSCNALLLLIVSTLSVLMSLLFLFCLYWFGLISKLHFGLSFLFLPTLTWAPDGI